MTAWSIDLPLATALQNLLRPMFQQLDVVAPRRHSQIVDNVANNRDFVKRSVAKCPS
jgi:hypothetical protein